MVFSDTADLKGLIQDCEFFTGLGNAQISGNTDRLDHFTRLINQSYHKVVLMILNNQDEWDFDDSNHTDFAVLTTSLVSGQRDYSLPVAENVLEIKRVDVLYSGTGNTGYRAQPVDSGEIGFALGNDVDIDSRFDKTKPFYDLQANSLWLYPRAIDEDVTNSGIIRIEWTRGIVEFINSDTTKEPGIPIPFHRLLSLGASYDWASTNDLKSATRLKKELDEMETRLTNYYTSKQRDRVMVLTPVLEDYS